MTIAASPAQAGTPTGSLYDPAVVQVKHVRLEDARKRLGNLVEESEETGVHTALSRYGKPKVVIVPLEDYRRYRSLDGEPTDL
ncbi:MAG TPA: type II toxin-antitoxin system Phd/YefM family antitoxin [Polyangia bacterium]